MKLIVRIKHMWAIIQDYISSINLNDLFFDSDEVVFILSGAWKKKFIMRKKRNHSENEILNE